VLLLLMGASAVEGSCRWWSRGHRAHHRYVDTDKDPYAVVKGFWHAHIGWMLVKQDPAKIGVVDIEDLDADPLVAKRGLFNRLYLPIALFMGFVLPTLACGLGWGDWYGGYFIAGVARLVFVHHSTFCVNSLAHYAGAATYTDGHTARNSIITALVTLGEGYHNFHHEFPSDYRNGVEWWQYDPTKHFIYALSLLGLAYNLKAFPQNEIDKGMLQMRQKELNALKLRNDWGPDPARLPLLSRAEFDARCRDGEDLMILDGYVLAVALPTPALPAGFLPTHPGGEAILRGKRGKDVTLDMAMHERAATPADAAELSRPAGRQIGLSAIEFGRGKAAEAPADGGKAAAGAGRVVGFYKHSNAARSLAETLRVARIEGYQLPAGATDQSRQAYALGFGAAAGFGKKAGKSE
jgi:stearoyl-CoA desaturase (delta-9 desaturase)